MRPRLPARQLLCTAALLGLASPGMLSGQTSAPPRPAAPTVTLDSLAGTYDGSQREVAAQLLLRPDGHFVYELAYGALDETADGTWQLAPGAVLLTAVPLTVPPRFVVESDTPEPRGGLWIKLSSGPLMADAPQRVFLFYGPGEAEDLVEIAEDGQVPLPGGRHPSAFLLEIPVYPAVNKPIPLSGTTGHRIVLRFERNDMGKADFRAQRLAMEEGTLIMLRQDLQLILHFRRERPARGSGLMNSGHAAHTPSGQALGKCPSEHSAVCNTRPGGVRIR